MRTFNEFMLECYLVSEDAADKFAAMDDKQFQDWVKNNQGAAAKAKKLRDEGMKRRNVRTPSSTPRPSASPRTRPTSPISRVNIPSGASRISRVAGRIAGPLSAAADVARERSKGSGWLRSLAKGAVTAAGGTLGATAGSVAGPVGTVAGGVGGAEIASRGFDAVAGKNAKERETDRVKNRQRQAGGALVGIGGKTSFDKKKNTMTTGSGNQRKTVKLANTSVVKDPKSGKEEVGYLAYKNGKAVYKRAQAPGTNSSNPLERFGRWVNPGAYKDHDAKINAQKLATARKNDQQRSANLGIKPKNK